MEIEFLPPPEKPTCPDCKKKYRRLHRCKDKIKRCTNCKKKKPTNKFYVPEQLRREKFQRIGKFSMTDAEKRVMRQTFMQQGMSSGQAWNKVNKHCNILKGIRSRKRGLVKIEENREIKKKQDVVTQKKKFLEGLKKNV